MRALVTGAAGFVGSHVADALAQRGDVVRGVDCFSTFAYGRAAKESNIAALHDYSNFSMLEVDLRTADLESLLEGIEVVFHLAAQPGVRGSWSTGFPEYVENNVLVTQRLLEAVRGSGIKRFVYSSSSSVYGNRPVFPVSEEDRPQPFSPYGVTKLAGELLCSLYGYNFSVPVASLRYFTVYGPRQRPDMAIHRLIKALLGGDPFPMFGAGDQVRDFTFVDDVVNANLLAADVDAAVGSIFNIAGGSSITMAELIGLVETVAGKPVPLTQHPAQAGDVKQTGGTTTLARQRLGWAPAVDLPTGIARQIEWHQSYWAERFR